jgi:hypothetical protein
MKAHSFMDTAKLLVELRQELQNLNNAILALERLARGGGKRRGRPPAWVKDATIKKPGRPLGSKNKLKEL